jgi:hypothetical protein
MGLDPNNHGGTNAMGLDRYILVSYGVYQFYGYLTRDKKNACAIFLSDS